MSWVSQYFLNLNSTSVPHVPFSIRFESPKRESLIRKRTHMWRIRMIGWIESIKWECFWLSPFPLRVSQCMKSTLDSLRVLHINFFRSLPEFRRIVFPSLSHFSQYSFFNSVETMQGTCDACALIVKTNRLTNSRNPPHCSELIPRVGDFELNDSLWQHHSQIPSIGYSLLTPTSSCSSEQ